MKVEISNGEIVDKFSILSIKMEKVHDENARFNIKREYEYLNGLVQSLNISDEVLNRLDEVNRELWEIEDRLRILERDNIFSDEFILLARSVYLKNDLRASIKKEINISTNSNFVEEKIFSI